MNTFIPKIIHVSWKSKDILKSEHNFAKNTILKLSELSPNWKITVTDDQELDDYLKSELDKSDYNLIKDKHIVEKCDLWRLLKLYTVGGLYVDIDRLCNTAIDDIISKTAKVILPTCADNDFSHDIMCSAPQNPIFLETIHLNLERRKYGIDNIYFLGPQTYTDGIKKAMFGSVDVNLNITEIRKELETIDFIQTYREIPPMNTFLYRPENYQVNFDHEIEKRNFYKEYKIKHWTNEW